MRGLTVRGSGRDLEKMDSGVFIEKTRSRRRRRGQPDRGQSLRRLHPRRRRCGRAPQRDHRASGTGRMNEAGNGVSVWDAPGAKVLDNDIRFGRDGIFSIASRKNVFSGNRFRDLRFAVHYMYTNDSEVTDNVSIGNTVGYAIMYSHRLTIRGNVSDGDRDHGFLFNFANGSQITGNTVVRAAPGRPSAGPASGMRRQRGARARPARRTVSPSARSRRATASARRNASSSTTPTRTASATTGSRAARSASTSPPAPRATRSPATPSSRTATR